MGCVTVRFGGREAVLAPFFRFVPFVGVDVGVGVGACVSETPNCTTTGLAAMCTNSVGVRQFCCYLVVSLSVVVDLFLFLSLSQSCISWFLSFSSFISIVVPAISACGERGRIGD